MQFPQELLSLFVESESQEDLEHVCEAQERVKFHSSETVASFIEEAVSPLKVAVACPGFYLPADM